VVAVRQKYEFMNEPLNIVFVVIGYFGSKREKDNSDEEPN